MKSILIKINEFVKKIKDFLLKAYPFIVRNKSIIFVILFVVLFVISMIIFYIKLNNLKKELSKKDDIIFDLRIELLNQIDYQKTKESYEKTSDTNRVITNSKLDSLLSRYYY